MILVEGQRLPWWRRLDQAKWRSHWIGVSPKRMRRVPTFSRGRHPDFVLGPVAVKASPRRGPWEGRRGDWQPRQTRITSSQSHRGETIRF